MQLADFDFILPEELIAHYPLPNRSDARLLIGNSLDDKIFSDILEYLKPGDILVLNDTKVLPARLFGRKATGGKVEVMLDSIMSDTRATALLKSSKSPKVGDSLYFEVGGHTVTALIIEKAEMFYTLEFSLDILSLTDAIGHIPLPPYIKREDTPKDREEYQTVFAKHPGAVAAPTASLHFTTKLLEQITAKGVHIEYVTLHVGSGTFLPIRDDNITNHIMHSEWYSVSAQTVEHIQRAKGNHAIVAVGTTVVRVLETIAANNYTELTGSTNIFIYPGFRYQLVDKLITNFHLPKSTLLLLVSAFAGEREIKEIYQHAIQHQYRFFSYGDAMLLECK